MPKSFLSENINNILSIARLAPSVHNTQPWRVRLKGDELFIEVEPSRQLTHGDPTGRQTYISLGIFTESCLMALEHLGLKATVNVSDGGEIELKVGQGTKTTQAEADIKALKERFTDRSVYKKSAISASQKSQIEAAWKTKSTQIRVSDQPQLIDQCAALTKSGLLLALTSPDFRHELVKHLVPSNKSPKGIPLNTLKGNRLLVRQLLARGISRRSEAQKEYKRWASASALVFVLSEGDSKPFWIDAGRAYLRASLAIQKLGLAQATSAAIVEASDFHEDIEKTLGTNMRLLCLLRVGKSNAKQRPSGRFEPGDLLAT